MTVRRGLFWPLLLIVVGLVFLLANFGFVAPVSILALVSLWPLILILIGVDIAIGRRWPLAALAADVVIIAIGIGVLAAYPAGAQGGPFFTTAGTGSTSVTAPRENARTMQLRISGGAGTYNLSGATQSELVRAESTRGDLHIRTSTKNDSADVRVDQSGFEGFRFGPSAPAQVDVTIADDVPTSLQIDVGAGEFDIDLSKVKITDARLSAGASSLRVTAPTPTGDVAMSISAGASNVIIEVPQGIEARITTSGGLSSAHFEPRFSGGETAGYATAKDRVTIRITSGVSQITVR